MSSAHSLQSAQLTPEAPRPFDEDDEYGDAEKNFQPRSSSFWVIIIGMYASNFLVALVSFAGNEVYSAGSHSRPDQDRMIIAPAIPGITNEFHSIGDIGRYGSPLFGRIYQLYPIKWVFLVSILVFEVGSALCGAAPSSAAFIVGRAIAGIFCGGIMVIVPFVCGPYSPPFSVWLLVSRRCSAL